MTKEKDIVVGIDVGTSKICTMVGKITSKDVEIIGMGLVPSKGMRKGTRRLRPGSAWWQ